MRQTLCYIPDTCYGIPVFGWGWGLVMLLAIVVITHLYQYVRHRKITDVGSSLALLGIVGVLFVFVVPNLVEAGYGVPIRGYGVCLLVAILAALALVIHLAKRRGMVTEQIYSLCFWAVISGIIGARLFYVTEYWQEMLRFDSTGKLLLGESLVSILSFTNGGLTVLGSVLGGMLGCVVFMRLNKMPMLSTFDILATALPLGMSIGRIGCLLNGCCFGSIAPNDWGIVFPAGSPAHEHQVKHGDVFYYGLKFKEIDVPKSFVGSVVPRHWKTMLVVESVQANSHAEKLGVQPGMLLRFVSCKQDGEPLIGEPQNRQEAAKLFMYLCRIAPKTEVQFEFLPNTDQTDSMPYRIAPSASEVLPVYPTQIYSSILALILCGTLLCLGRLRFYKQRAGLVLASFMILYSVGRFMIEFVRTDEDPFFSTGLTISQNVSIFFCLAGVALFVYICKIRDKNQ
jgi:phosphatidylglycerol:prolipoprotein diacylglycerol transferase